MHELLTGHIYEMAVIHAGADGKDVVRKDYAQKIEFMKKEDGKIVMQGTTNEEVLRMMIARMKYLQDKLPCIENAIVINRLEESLLWLNVRTKKRVEQGVENTHQSHKE